MALPGLITSGTSIAGYAGLLLVGRTILHGIANYSLSVLLGGHTMLHGITNNSLKVDCFRNQYRRVRTILPSIANSSPRADCFRNQYRRVRRVTARWANDFAWHNL